jgi:decaprenylphospho-beta-D-erythro-pentofuranosid-2-ulose 2-reductase
MPTVLILGGTSDIARALCRDLAHRDTRTIILAGRNENALKAYSTVFEENDGPTVHIVAFDATDPTGHTALLDDVTRRFGDLDLVVLAFGSLGDPAHLAENHLATVDLLSTNYLGAASVLHPVTQHLSRQGHGTIVVLSSAAAYRPLPTNYAYASSKAALDHYCLGLSENLAGTGVRLMVVRPGYVHTKMTSHLPAPPMATTPDNVAAAITRAFDSQKDVVWVPSRIRWATLLLRHLPPAVIRKLPYR